MGTITNLMLANKQPTPKYTYAVWDEGGMVCILAKFEAHLTITYDTRNGPQVCFVFCFDVNIITINIAN